MLKSELLNLINNIEDDKEIDEIILNNGFAKPLDTNGFNELLASNKDIQSLVDGKVTKGIESFKKKSMPKLIEAEVLKRTGENETPEQKAIRDLQTKLENMEKEKARAEMVAKFKDTLTEKNIPSNLINFVLGDDEEATNANITLFENTMQSYINNQVQSKLNNGYKPPTTETTVTAKTYESLLNNDNLSMEEALEYFNNNN
ncbi:MAG: DUF4355 domain-containing protein [Clostridium baratii]|uniref:capsid assembly scaffolding protein Gp46 family protein n=1 Tax=Clostridium baratii TaxID=1561 RepID=UPI00242A50D5|nr:DUF4355 domain-containing protein [Clostridium baratii]MBS6006888.1 DUF4355 domain-containing protein [Clostridium baratii]MDU1053435.1 DUF4355 domain-containing protein [Clostridium baratii]